MLRVPERCSSLLALPPLPALTELLLALRKADTQASASRVRDRQELLALAAAQTAELEREGGGRVDPAAPIVVTGHQPGLYGPGVWVRSFVVDTLSRRHEVTGIHLTVDADRGDARLSLPTGVESHLRRVSVTLPGIRSGRPWESQPPLDLKGWRVLFDQVRAVIAPTARSTFESFAACAMRARGVQKARTLADSLSAARRAWEAEDGPRAYLELSVARLSRSMAFLRFVAEVLVRLPSFHEIHNTCLAEHRRHRRLRGGAGPVPDLRRQGARWEAPFWCMNADGERAPLFLDREAMGWGVVSRGQCLGRLPDACEADWPTLLHVMLSAAGAGIRPRALTLPMFVRRALADLFLHGVGGAGYEQVGEEVARRFFDEPAAPWAVVSATLCLGRHPNGQAMAEAQVETAADVRRGLRDLMHNPQRFASSSGPLAEPVARKRQLIDAIQASCGVRKRQINEEIDRVNAQLRAALHAVESDMRERLARAEAVEHADAALHWRGYPFILFRPEDVGSRVRSEFDSPRSGFSGERRG